MRTVQAFVLLAFAFGANADETTPVASETTSDLGAPVAAATLDELRGGDEDITTNVIRVTGDVSGNSATDVATGANTIREGSFADASGLTTVVQNTGANVLIQSATIVNVQFVDP